MCGRYQGCSRVLGVPGKVLELESELVFEDVVELCVCVGVVRDILRVIKIWGLGKCWACKHMVGVWWSCLGGPVGQLDGRKAWVCEELVSVEVWGCVFVGGSCVSRGAGTVSIGEQLYIQWVLGLKLGLCADTGRGCRVRVGAPLGK